jgi:hypothetical protein
VSVLTTQRILSATLEIAKAVPRGERFQASKVRDELKLPAGKGFNEPIRECWRNQKTPLAAHGLVLIAEPKKKCTYWYLEKRA